MSKPNDVPNTLLAAASPRERWRTVKDVAARYAVAVGGVGVILAVVLIFFYLLYIVFPLFVPASAGHLASYPLPGGESRTLHLAIEEQSTMAVRYTGEGEAVFFTTGTGAVVERIGTGVEAVRSVAVGAKSVALGLADGRALLVQHRFKVTFPNDRRTLTPALEYPYGERPLVVDEQGQALEQLAMSDSEDELLFAALRADGRVALARFTKETSFLTDEVSLERSAAVLEAVSERPAYVRIAPDQRRLYVAASSGRLWHYDISDLAEPRLIEQVDLTADGVELTALDLLLGGFSLLAGGSDGSVAQWFPVRDGDNTQRLQRIRGFDAQQAPVAVIAAEQRRKGFLAADSQGRVGIYHATAQRTLLVEPMAPGAVVGLAVAPRSNRLLVEGAEGELHYWRVANEHPEVSWSALWGEVHYEGYPEPAHIWQSSASNNDFEPKFSLTPLAFGTLKAAFYAMLLAVPIAILGAIYTAYFMAPRMRGVVKPTIEIMEALPTVILGFLAGLWLAPVIETHLPGVFALLVVEPLGILAFAFLWRQLPVGIRGRVPEGWEGLLLVPVVLLLGWLAFALSTPLESLLFGGDMVGWLTQDLGVGFDQRNSIVVGLAMGFAVIPTIFSITEDAIFSVPKHLSFGSLALGATPWQTLTRVVLLTASPGIFSAVMIGMGRAVGETMIVLMATGNTPLMDASIFQGMRTLSANIAVEMPESEVHSTHYRVLFLAALVLFAFTFVVNTVAELVRHRLRRKYSSL